jgi:signal transduction histidine kinase/DNA-binding response OmpR family regulator
VDLKQQIPKLPISFFRTVSCFAANKDHWRVSLDAPISLIPARRNRRVAFTSAYFGQALKRPKPERTTTYVSGDLDPPMARTQHVSFCHNSARCPSGRQLPVDELLPGYAVMRGAPPVARTLFAVGAIVMVAHATLLVFNPLATFPSNLFVLMYPLLGFVACLLGAYRDSPETRPLWLLLACGLLLAVVGQVGLTYYEFATNIHTQTQASHFDFFYFAYGIPVMLAICSRSTDSGLKIFAWLDGAQAVIAAMLAYLQLFSILPSHAGLKGISAIDLMYLNNTENLILVGAVTLRFFSSPSPARRRFYRTLSLFLWVDGSVALILGYLELQGGWRDGPQDIAWGFPHLSLLGSFALLPKTRVDESQRSSSQRTVGLLIDNLSPLLFTLAITLMGVEIAPEHPWFGFASISAAIAIYGIRAAILQVRYARSQEELTKAMIATEQASRAKSQFLANMSHEIRTPMNGILGMTELALSTALSEEQRDFLLTVKSSADRLLSIINEILDYSKMEAGKTILDSVAFHLPGLVKDVLRSFAFAAHQKGLELTVYIAPDVPADLIGDPTRLSQVLINLVGNAIKFTEHGEVGVDISLEAMIDGRAGLQFSIRDTGIGIAADQQGALFQEFQQAHTSGNRLYGGTGLGLAVSKSIVTLMGGAIGLKSVPGEGTTITFDAHFDVSPSSAASLAIKTEEDLHGIPLLIIDDNATNRRIVSELARQWKMEPQMCDSGESGLAELSRAAYAGTPYRLVLLDEQMPGIDGFALLDRIRGNPLLLSPVVMMLTSHDQVRSAARCRQMGVETYLIKPISSSDLLGSIRLALGARTPASPVAPVTTGIAASSLPLKILLAEDNVVNQRVAMTMLGKMGHGITLATNGLEALEQWRQGDFDLILMDVQMPEMTGLEATKRIRREEAIGTHVPIVAMTASAMSEDRDHCLAAGMDDFISKPVSSKVIEEIIAATFSRLS